MVLAVNSLSSAELGAPVNHYIIYSKRLLFTINKTSAPGLCCKIKVVIKVFVGKYTGLLLKYDRMFLGWHLN